MIRYSRHQWRAIVAFAGALLASMAHQASAADIQGPYTCQLDGTQDDFEILPSRARVPAVGEIGIDVTGNEIEIFHLRFTVNPAAVGSSIEPFTVTLDPAVPASGPVRPFISSFGILPVGLQVAEDGAAGDPVRIAAELFATFVTDGISGILSGEIPSETKSPASVRFSLDLACRQAPISVKVDKLRVCPGEDVVVVAESDGAEQIWIDGVPGARRILEFSGPPGPRRILVTARSAAGGYEHRVRTVELRDCGPRERFPVLVVTPSVFRPDEMELLVDNSAALGLSGAEYRWSFGDGTTATTKVPFVTHSYVEHMPVDQEVVTFEAEVTIQQPNGVAQGTRKTIALWNHYVFSRRRGTVQLPVEVASPRLAANAGQWTGQVILRNLESEPVAFHQLEMELQPCDGDQDPQPLPPLAITLGVQPKAVATLPVALPQSGVPANACGLAVHLSGHGPDGLAALADAYFDIPRQAVGGAPVKPEVSALLGELVTEGWVADPEYVSFEELRRLGLEGRIPPVFEDREAVRAAAVSEAAVPGEDEEPVPGKECNLSAPGRPGLTCQATDEFAEDPTPPRVANALKGDLLLHAECNLIGPILRDLKVPQQYTHEAIMTRNHYELRHHTAPFAWFTDHRSGRTIDGDVLKYGWPGTITMSASDAFQGRNYLDPEGTNRSLSAINLRPTRCHEDAAFSPPLVVKPHPEGYKPEVRERLKLAADKAKEIQGHYRFHAFTDGAISLNSDYDAPGSIAWAANSPAAVSSTFIWTALHLANVKLEGDLTDGPEDAEDVRNGASRDHLTLDGLYFYDEEERKAGLEVLYNEIERLQQEGAPFLLAGYTAQMSDQLANCFAADRCSEDDTDKGWKEPGVGRTVSPNNFLFWDKPKHGGSYGLKEPLVFRDGGYRRIHRWKATENTGRVEVTVVWDADGSPAQEAHVVLLGLEHVTDGSGKTVFEAIPQGTYEVQATKSKGDPPQLYSVDCRSNPCVVTVAAGTTSSITLRLRAPEPDPRWYVASLAKATFLDDSEPGDRVPAEARFIVGGTSKKHEFGGNGRSVVFPVGAFVGVIDPQTILFAGQENPIQTLEPQVPIFWDLQERLGEELQLGLVAYERDGSSPYLDWLDEAIGAIVNGIACYKTGGSTCSGPGDIAAEAGKLLQKAWGGGDNPDDRFGDEKLTCFKAGNYCLGEDSQRERRLTFPRDSATPDVELWVDLRQVPGPRLSILQVWLESVRITAGAADDSGDAKNGEEIFLDVRVAPLTLAGGDTLNTPFRLPTKEDQVYKLCTADDRSRGCRISDDAVKFIHGPAGDALLYPRPGGGEAPASDANGTPAVFVEIGVWEEDPGDDDLIGTHTKLIWLDELLDGKAEATATFTETVTSVANFGRDGFSGPVRMQVTSAEITYSIYVVRAED